MSDKPLIIVIDDDVLTTEMISDGLEDQYHIVGFTNPMEALSQVAALQPALILLDINMPQMDGYEVCRRLKDDFDTSDIPVVFLSGLDGAGRSRGRIRCRRRRLYFQAAKPGGGGVAH